MRYAPETASAVRKENKTGAHTSDDDRELLEAVYTRSRQKANPVSAG